MPQTAGATLMDGTALSRTFMTETSGRAQRFRSQAGRPPCLAAVLVGEDAGSVTYVKMKQARCATAGIDSRLIQLPTRTTTPDVLAAVRSLSEDPKVDGILVQHPVPAQVDERAAFEAITPDKDVDGVTMHSFAAMALGIPTLASCTPAGIMRLLDEYDVDPAGRHAVVIGRSPILGLPIGMLLLARNATVTYCHSHTLDLASVVRTADIIVAAVGKPEFVRGSWLKPGVVVVDAGYNDGNVGDVAFGEAIAIASLITPVPGGVGPMTIAVLLQQTVDAAERIRLRTNS